MKYSTATHSSARVHIQIRESRRVRSRKLICAKLVCAIVPSSCPFEREITLFNRTIVRIPPLCKLNPFYEQIVHLRFKSLTYLVEQCGEDIAHYC